MMSIYKEGALSFSNVIKELRWLYFVIKRRVVGKVERLIRVVNSPRIPQNIDGRTLIHLGCGDVAATGYINVDFKPAPHVHFIHDVTHLPFFEDDYADLIYACHVIEHFPFDSLRAVLYEWRRVLKGGGILRLSVPDFDKLLVLYKDSNNNVESIRQPLMGLEDGYNSHLLIFNFDFIKKILESNGFKNVRVWNPSDISDHDFEDWSCRSLVYDGRTYSISLNVEAEKLIQ
jgi:predicted SAM-dependent methyltransferase